MKKILLSFVAIFSLAIVFSSCGTDYTKKDSLKDVKGEEFNKVLDQYDELVTEFLEVTKDAIEYAKQKGEAPDSDSKLVKKAEELSTKIEKLSELIHGDDDVWDELAKDQKKRFRKINKKFEKAFKMDLGDFDDFMD